MTEKERKKDKGKNLEASKVEEVRSAKILICGSASSSQTINQGSAQELEGSRALEREHQTFGRHGKSLQPYRSAQV